MNGRDADGTRRVPDLARPLRVVVGAAFIAIVVLTVAQVFCRSVLGDPLIWSEEVVRLLLVWVVFLGAAVVTWDGRHLNIDVVFIRLPARARSVLRWLNRVVALTFLVVFGWTSLEIVDLNRWDELGALEISMAWVRVPATIGAALMVLLLVARVACRVRAPGKDRDGEPL